MHTSADIATVLPLSGIVSPLVIADRLIGLAQDADRAGLRRPAASLVRLAYRMYDEQPLQHSLNAAWPAGDLSAA